MEELSNLIWLGGVIAEQGPHEFKRLWRPFRAALEHYIYGFSNKKATDSEFAHRCLWAYAAAVDCLVGQEMVCAPVTPIKRCLGGQCLPHRMRVVVEEVVIGHAAECDMHESTATQ